MCVCIAPCLVYFSAPVGVLCFTVCDSHASTILGIVRARIRESVALVPCQRFSSAPQQPCLFAGPCCAFFFLPHLSLLSVCPPSIWIPSPSPPVFLFPWFLVRCVPFFLWGVSSPLLPVGSGVCVSRRTPCLFHTSGPRPLPTYPAECVTLVRSTVAHPLFHGCSLS